jgi:nitroreductase
MDFAELIEKRYSVRAYKSDPVDDQLLTRLLETAVMAPSAANRQPFQLVVIHTRGREVELRRIYDRDWFVQAPVVICACGIPAQGWIHPNGKNHHEIDAVIVMDYLTLAAANVGLGTCWIAAFDVWAAREVLNLPVDVEPVVFTPLGYPADSPTPKERKPLTDLVRYEGW